MRAWIGIDPGQTGALASSDEEDEILLLDWPGDERALRDLVRGVAMEYDVAAVAIEAQQSMPKQGVASVFKLGYNYGLWMAAIAFAAWPLLPPMRPAVWKSGLGYPKGADKEYSLTLARRLFPQAESRLSRKKDHGRAEALILAHCARKESRNER